jgi:hypothetical protein
MAERFTENSPHSGKRTFWLRIDPSLPNPYTARWVSDLKDATPFRTECEVQAVKGQVKDALGVSKGMDGLFYVAR